MVKQKKDLKLIYTIISKLENCKPIPEGHKPHLLKGKFKNYKECHILPDWLLIWKEDRKNIFLTRTGSHSELFKK